MRYTVILEQESDGGYVATVPALPGCITQGDTRDEVLKNIREAAYLYIEDCIASGDPFPLRPAENTSSSKPALGSEASGGSFGPGIETNLDAAV